MSQYQSAADAPTVTGGAGGDFVTLETFDTSTGQYSPKRVTINNLFSGATLAEINAVADVSANSETVTATKSVTTADSGRVFYLNSTTEFVTTLPAPAAGLCFTFIVTGAPAGASYTIVATSSANIIKGSVYSSDLNAANDSDFETSGGDTISFVDGKAVAGDRVDVFCDGTNYFAYGFCTAFDAITITTAS